MPTTVTLRSRLPMIAATLRSRVGEDLRETAEAVAERAAENVNLGPVAPHIADEIEVSGGGAEYTVSAGGDVYYAKWIEFGRKNAPPYPFMVPAAEVEQPAFEDRVNNTLSSL